MGNMWQFSAITWSCFTTSFTTSFQQAEIMESFIQPIYTWQLSSLGLQSRKAPISSFLFPFPLNFPFIIKELSLSHPNLSYSLGLCTVFQAKILNSLKLPWCPYIHLSALDTVTAVDIKEAFSRNTAFHYSWLSTCILSLCLQLYLPNAIRCPDLISSTTSIHIFYHHHPIVLCNITTLSSKCKHIMKRENRNK